MNTPDWALILLEIQKSGMTQKAIADACNCSQATISGLSTGKQKKTDFEIGNRLLELQRNIHGAAGVSTSGAA